MAEANAARLPKIALTAGVSSISSDVFVLKEQDYPVFSLGANLAAPIFHGWALQANVEIRTAEQKIAIADYGRVASRAFSEVESALSATFAADERESLLGRAVASNARAVVLAQTRLRVGSGDLRSVLQQNVALFGARGGELSAQDHERTSKVCLDCHGDSTWVQITPCWRIPAISQRTCCPISLRSLKRHAQGAMG